MSADPEGITKVDYLVAVQRGDEWRGLFHEDTKAIESTLAYFRSRADDNHTLGRRSVARAWAEASEVLTSEIRKARAVPPPEETT